MLVVWVLAIVVVWALIAAAPAPTPSGSPALQTAIAIVQAATAEARLTPGPSPTFAGDAPLPGVLDAPPLLKAGWQAFGPPSDPPLLARSSVKPDPKRPWVELAVVRFDATQVRLHMVPGKTEPVAAPNTPSFPRPGTIPAADQTGALVAAFNGGFKARHGAYGMMVDGITILPPLEQIATLAIYQDGSFRIGAWGREITTTQQPIAYRQNCPLLVDAGDINPTVAEGRAQDWGYTVKNSATTYRSGLGLSSDNRFLIYGVGNALTVGALAEGLRQAGAYYAMELDVNFAYTRFVTFRTSEDPHSAHPVVAENLLKEMLGNESEFLVPYNRDFFYVTIAPKT
jgi:hypothetical protein